MMHVRVSFGFHFEFLVSSSIGCVGRFNDLLEVKEEDLSRVISSWIRT